jgi:hypothetical protein
MTALENTSHDHEQIGARLAQDSRIHSPASKVGRFLLHLLEMLLAMEAGMVIFHLLANQIPATSSLATVADSETVLHNVVMDVFMTVPMLAWMILRGHGWHQSLEMGVAMLAPIAAINLLCSLGVVEYLPWLAKASGPAMYLGMLVAMLYRRSHYTVKASHSGHAAH